MLVLTQKESVRAYPYSVYQLKKANPEVSFPVSPGADLLAEFGVYNVVPSERPEIDEFTHTVQEINPKLIDGKWVQQFKIVPHTKEHLEDIQRASEKQVREKRDRLLSSSDWTQLPDSPPNIELWRAYRQELREITKQEGFPLNVNWPTPPTD